MKKEAGILLEFTERICVCYEEPYEVDPDEVDNNVF